MNSGPPNSKVGVRTHQFHPFFSLRQIIVEILLLLQVRSSPLETGQETLAKEVPTVQI